jgi:hypothetical protein
MPLTPENLNDSQLNVMASIALQRLSARLAMLPTIATNFSANVGDVGDIVNVPIPPIFKASRFATNINKQQPTTGKVPVEMKAITDVSFSIADAAKAMSNPDQLQMYVDAAVDAHMVEIEGDLLAQGAMFDSLGAANTPLTESIIDQAEMRLFNNFLQDSSPRSLVVSAEAYSQLRQNPRFSENQTNGNGGAIETGLVGKLKNFSVYRSQLVPKVGNQTNNLAFGRDALILVNRGLPRPMDNTPYAIQTNMAGLSLRVTIKWDQNTKEHVWSWDTLYGIGVARPGLGVQVLS